MRSSRVVGGALCKENIISLMSNQALLLLRMEMSKYRRLLLVFVSFFGLWMMLLCSLAGPSRLPSQGNAESQHASKNESLDRVSLLKRKCTKYSNPFRPERRVLFEDRSLGVEVVHFPTPFIPMSACIPHKTGSKSWGIFARDMEEQFRSPTFDNYKSFSWKEKSSQAFKILVVRHPLERLVSVYRMIFEDWCDPNGIPAKSWHICSQEMFDKDFRSSLLNKISKNSSSNSFLSFMFDSYRYSNDLYIFKIWEELHPNLELHSPQQLRFTFPEFVFFLTRGSRDPFIARHNGVSYHWAPIWKECSLCSELTLPDYIAHLETLTRDLEFLENVAKVTPGSFLDSFPHAHDQRGTFRLSLEYYKTISKDEVKALAGMYALDMELFGFNIDPFLEVAL